MAVSAKMYEGFLTHLGEGGINLASDTFKVALCTSSYTPNQDSHVHLSDITNELSGGNYSRATLSNVSVSTSGTRTLKFDADDTTFASITGTARYAVIYDDTATNDPLLGYVDFGQDEARTAQNLLIQWNASGIFTITVAA